jgi:hypothetical protein
MLLKLLDLQRHGWLRQVQFFSRPRVAEMARHGLEGFQLSQRSVLHSGLLLYYKYVLMIMHKNFNYD